MQSHARLHTDKAARYMTQLAKHWSHRFEVAFDATSARIPLPLGTCLMRAEPDGWWVLELAGEPGTYELTVRRDGGEWLVPPGLIERRDEFGGVAGLVTLP